MLKRKPIITAITLTMSNLAHADLTTGLVAYYPFTGNANDAGGNGNNRMVYSAILIVNNLNRQ